MKPAASRRTRSAVRALGVRLGPGHHELGLGERGPALGKPVGAEQPLRDLEQLAARSARAGGARPSSVELARAEAVLGGAGAPLLAQPGEVDVLLAVAGLERRDLGGLEAAVPLLVHVLDDLRPPGRELVDHLARHALSGRPAPCAACSHSTPSERESSARRCAW